MNERTGIQIWIDFRKLKAAKQVAILLDAMEYMKVAEGGVTQTTAIAYSMGYAMGEDELYIKVRSKYDV